MRHFNEYALFVHEAPADDVSDWMIIDFHRYELHRGREEIWHLVKMGCREMPQIFIFWKFLLYCRNYTSQFVFSTVKMNSVIKESHSLVLWYQHTLPVVTSVTASVVQVLCNVLCILDVSWQAQWLASTPRKLTCKILDMSQGRAPLCASSTIFCLVVSGKGLPFTNTPPSWFTPLWPKQTSSIKWSLSPAETMTEITVYWIPMLLVLLTQCLY